MLKKLLLGTLITVLSTGVAFGSVSAATTSTNDVTAAINGGDLELTMDVGALEFEGTINQDVDILNVNLLGTALDFTVKDDRGVKEKSIVQYTLTDFTIAGGTDTLVPTANITLNDAVTVLEFDPEVAPIVTDSIDLSNLEFSSANFVAAGTYTSTMTTSVVAAPVIP